MKRILYSCLFLLIGHFCTAQTNVDYTTLVAKADSLRIRDKYKASVVTYKQAFDIGRKKVEEGDLYNAACVWALSGNIDSAFMYLYQLVGNRYSYADFSYIQEDTDFSTLRKDERWSEIIQKTERNYNKAQQGLDKSLIAKLDSIYILDQGLRSKIDSIQNKFGVNSQERKELFRLMALQDSTNLILVKQIIKRRGWPGTDLVGKKGNKTIWLVVQHADLKTQLKYLPKLKNSVRKGKTPAWYLALTEDRIAMYQGEKQIYGTQYEFDPETEKYRIYPIADEIHVNERRKRMGLPSLEQDAKNYGIDYKLPEKD